MSFKARNLCVLSYANGFTLWHYTSTDHHEAITTANYFNDAGDMLRKGDLIIVNSDTGGTQQNKFIFVTNVSLGVVTVAGA